MWAGRPESCPGDLRAYGLSLEVGRAVRLDYREHLPEDFRPTGNDIASGHIVGFSGEIGDQPPRFENQQDAGCHIPRHEAHLPEAIEPATGNVGEIQRSGARATDAGGFLGQFAEHAKVSVNMIELAEGEAGTNEGLIEAGAAGYPDTAVIQEGATATGGREHFVPDRVVDNSMFKNAITG